MSPPPRKPRPLPFGPAWVFHMDVAGAAVATMLSNAISMVYFFVVLYRIRKETVLTIDEKRAERIVTVYGQREESPVQRLHDKDQKRKEFYELYTGTQWGQADNYDLCLDSGRLGIEPCVDMIAALYQQRCSKATAT
ncbi:hypothetical protein B5F98_11630 [Pseudoflavonifractor sp. An44]|nr:hypothetical protein B5F98_11630 [Pseudoflavonifractor sp. An44]